jgi:hypothetical protein
MDLYKFTKELNRIEIYTAKFIYKKYIETKNNDNDNDNDNTILTITSTSLETETKTETEEKQTKNESDNDSDAETETEEEEEADAEPEIEIPKYIYSQKPNSNIDFKLYLNKIFANSRKSIITQEESIISDLKNIFIANNEYNKKPEKFKRLQNKSHPDIKRCCYIRKFKNKYIRCALSSNNEDEKYCYKHYNKLNIYWDNYSQIINKLEKQIK